jgi:hypothetical protein
VPPYRGIEIEDMLTTLKLLEGILEIVNSKILVKRFLGVKTY